MLKRLGFGLGVAVVVACGSDAAMKAGGEMMGDAGRMLSDAGMALVDAGSSDARAATEGGTRQKEGGSPPRATLEANCDQTQVVHTPLGGGAYIETTTYYAVFDSVSVDDRPFAVVCGLQTPNDPPACNGSSGCTVTGAIPTDGCVTAQVTIAGSGGAYVQCGSSTTSHPASGTDTVTGSQRWQTVKLISG